MQRRQRQYRAEESPEVQSDKLQQTRFSDAYNENNLGRETTKKELWEEKPQMIYTEKELRKGDPTEEDL